MIIKQTTQSIFNKKTYYFIKGKKRTKYGYINSIYGPYKSKIAKGGFWKRKNSRKHTSMDSSVDTSIK